MKIKSVLAFVLFLGIVNVFGQKVSVDLTFTAVNNGANVQLTSVKVMNRTQGGEKIIYWPDTTLSLEITPGDLLLCIGYSTGFPVGGKEINTENSSFQLFQSNPNPVKYQSMISMYIPEDGIVSIRVNDLRGTVIVSDDRPMEKGLNSIRFSPGNSSVYFLSVRWSGLTKTIKILNTEPETGNKCILEYPGSNTNDRTLQAQVIKKDLDIQETGILDTPVANKTYTFEFATNIPCPAMPTVYYEGQFYNTIQIFSQCWLKENLNVGTMILGTQNMINNSVIEKYCYNNKVDSCTKYGGLYQWDEVMQYTLQQGVQGICPSGWHVPTDEEWMVLEGAVDSQYGIGEPEWDMYLDRGFDAGMNLKSISGWFSEGNGTDLFGFSGLPGGYRDGSGFFFHYIGNNGYWWTSTEYTFSNVWNRNLKYLNPGVYRLLNAKGNGFSIRCLRDN